MDRFMKRLGQIFVIMLVILVCDLAVLSTAGIRGDFGLFNMPMALIFMFFPPLLIPIFIVLALYTLVKLFSPAVPQPYREAPNFSVPHLPDKVKFTPAGSGFSKVDSLLNELNDEERAYLERRLGTGELVVNDEGELLTLEEYRKQKRNQKE